MRLSTSAAGCSPIISYDEKAEKNLLINKVENPIGPHFNPGLHKIE